MIFGSSPPGINGSFGREPIGNSRKRCEPGTSRGGCAVRRQLNATREKWPARSPAQRPCMRSNAWRIPIDGLRRPSSNGTPIHGFSIRLRRDRPANRAGKAAHSRRLLHENHGRWTAGRLSAVSNLPQAHRGRRQRPHSYPQRVLGYGLTGLTREHALFFGYGTGANGKSVLLSTIAGILGKYHRTAPIETFTASNGDRHPTDLAGLRGARLVTATETEEGRRWAESRIKQLTGGDTVTARFMRQDFFEYRPQFKLIIAGNHKPSLRSGDEAIRRRFHLIPFAVTIQPEERVTDLAEKTQGRMAGHTRLAHRGVSGMAGRGPKAAQCSLRGDRSLSLRKTPSPPGSMRRAQARREHGNRQRRYSGRGAIGQPPQANIQAASSAFPRP